MTLADGMRTLSSRIQRIQIEPGRRILERGEEFSFAEHPASGKKLYIPNAYLIGDTACRDYTDSVLYVREGDLLSLIHETAKGCIVKKSGTVGWYCGKYEFLS